MTLRPMAIAQLQPTDLPVPPEHAFRVMQACRGGDVGAAHLAALVEQDPVIAAQLLRIANSAYFAQSSKVTSLPRAITVIGQRALRNLVLCVAIRGSVKAKDLAALPIDNYWEAALRRGVCARALAPVAGVDPDDAFAVGLLQDFGLLVLFFLYRDRVFDWPTLAVQNPEERWTSELELFGATHDEVGAQLAKYWRLPDEFAVTMGQHHQTERVEGEEALVHLGQVAQCADWMAAVFTTSATGKRQALKTFRSLLDARFGMHAEQSEQLLEQVSGDMEQAAAALGFDVEPQVGFSEMMETANLQLLDQNLSMQEMNWHLEQLISERDRAAEELQRELDLAREVQRGLFPARAVETSAVAGMNISCRAVSGDFYDFLELKDGSIAFCIADVSGKGMHAALLMAKASSLFHCLGKSIQDPGKLMTMLNRELVETSIRGMFITMVTGVVNPESGHVRLANAGHLPVVQMRAGRNIATYAANAPPLGVVAAARFDNQELDLGDDALYLFTDGLTEATTKDGGQIGLRGLVEVLARRSDEDRRQRLQQVMSDVAAIAPGRDDDMTLLVIERD